MTDPRERIHDNTALSAYQRCPQLYYKSMVQDRRRGGTTPALEYGKCLHYGFEILYKTHDEVLAKAGMQAKYASRLPSTGTDYRTIGRALLVFDEWLEKWGHPAHTIDKTLGWPTSPMVELSTNVVLPLTGLPYAVRVDRIYEEAGALFIEDHKTTSQFGATFYDEFQLSGQMMGYARAASVLAGKPIRGVRINVLCTRKSGSEFDRRILYFTPGQLEHWERNYERWLNKIHQSYDSSTWEFNFASCSTKYGMCTYHEVCGIDPEFHERALHTDFEVEPWDPNAQHDE